MHLMKLGLIAGFALLLLATLANASSEQKKDNKTMAGKENKKAASPDEVDKAEAIFAGGCFWCMEPPFDNIDGVLATISGYCGGKEKNPSYEQVSSGITGHAESVKVIYDPKKVSYQKLLDVFWMNIDPTAVDRQFVDVGKQYRSAIFYLTEEQKTSAEASKAALEKSKRFSQPIVTEITKAGEFFPAEDYHQDYYKKNPLRYKFYRFNSGRDRFINKHWNQ